MADVNFLPSGAGTAATASVRVSEVLFDAAFAEYMLLLFWGTDELQRRDLNGRPPSYWDMALDLWICLTNPRPRNAMAHVLKMKWTRPCASIVHWCEFSTVWGCSACSQWCSERVGSQVFVASHAANGDLDDVCGGTEAGSNANWSRPIRNFEDVFVLFDVSCFICSDHLRSTHGDSSYPL